MQAELDSFIAELKTKQPGDVIEFAYELTYKEDILQSFNFDYGGLLLMINKLMSDYFDYKI